MPTREVTPTHDLSPANWLTEAITSFDGTVASLMPIGYPAYLRLFHRPDQGRPFERSPQTWADVAAVRGTVLHPEAQWYAISRDSNDFVVNDEGTTSSETPLTGSLDPLTLPLLARHLAVHTTTPQTCHFALWNGYGSSPRSWDRYPQFHLPMRGYWLFPPAPIDTVVEHSVEFEVAGITEQAATPEGIPGLTTLGRVKQPADSINWVRKMREAGHLLSPSWWWPEDHSWAVLSETDYDSTLIAADVDLMNVLLADPDIECLRVSPSDSLLASADTVNDHWPPGTLRLNGTN